ncbi:DoxX family protein [Polynucleobacter wuianus]|uniref:DoxX family protein n=1 Tax=Polynucleobacter wuianus TaxID=1743168 RepID=A0A191UIQ2_9BURK|nr:MULTISPECIES: DoxX family protein [Polynucleobacter]ANJ00801.1 DoxX family protein [Polynucleobacter wuianus]MBU3553447.1 DoxX family protein [Polynucleobacter sp. MWH-Post4-6-1]
MNAVCQSTAKPLALVARILLAAIFISAGLSKLAGFEGTVGYIASKGLPIPSLIAALTIAVEVLGGIAIVIGYKVRVAGLLLAVFTLLAGFIFHNFWAVPADQAYIQNIMFMKNLSMAGGLLLLTVFGAGGLSVDAKTAAKES